MNAAPPVYVFTQWLRTASCAYCRCFRNPDGNLIELNHSVG